MITPKELLDASALARRLLFLRAQQANLEGALRDPPNLGLAALFDVVAVLECHGGARAVLANHLLFEVDKQIAETAKTLREAGVDPDAEWPHAEGFR